MKMRKQAFVWLCSLLVLGGCASTGTNTDDPLEGMNRKIFTFNDKVDTYALKPVAQGYQAAAPLPARTQVSNFFGNIEDVWSSFNNLLQGKPKDSANDLGRFVVNSTIGILGFFDVASEFGMDKHDEDLGQTLGVWGVGSGPYLVLPFFGSSTLRDSSDVVATSLLQPTQYIPSVAARNSVTALKAVNIRANLLGAETTLDQAALDKYVFMRNFYLQRRRSQIYDGQPPREKDDYDGGGALLLEPATFGEVYPRGVFDLNLVPQPGEAGVASK